MGKKRLSNGSCGSGKDTESFSWSKLFSNACDDIANSYEKGKNALLGIKEKADNSGKLTSRFTNGAGGSGSGDSTESFNTIVHPTQPEGHENFHSLF